MRLIVGTLAHKREELLELWCENILGIKELFKDKVEIVPICIGSTLNEKVICQKYGVDFKLHHNEPFKSKLNARSLFAKELGFDYLMLLGSDDFPCPNYFDIVIRAMNTNYQLIEVTDLYYLDSVTKSSAYCVGYTNHRKGEPMAVGRVMSYKVLKDNNFRLWNENSNYTPDYDINGNLNKHHYKRFKFSLKDKKAVILDVKGKGKNPFRYNADNWDMVDLLTFENVLVFDQLKNISHV